MQESIKQYGFIYTEEAVSPDGQVKVVYGYNDGEKGPITIEPRAIDVQSGEVLVDLWGAWCQGTVQFVKPGRLLVKVQDAYGAFVCEAEIDVDKRLFALASSPARCEPLTSFRQRTLELRGF